jgi:hypothetical protein
MKFKLLIICLFFSAIQPLFGQHYTHKLPLQKVLSKGWYKLELPANFLAVSKVNLSDVRLIQTWLKDSVIEIPYLVEQIKDKDDSVWYEAFKISNQTNASNSYVVWHQLASISRMQLKVVNHANPYVFSLSGSVNGKEWFSINNRMILPALAAENKTWDWIEIQFPRVSYPFLRLQFLDSTSAPIQLLEAGIFRNKKQETSMRKLIHTNYFIEQIPLQKITRIKVVSKNLQVSNKVVFSIASPTYFQRRVEVYRKVKGKNTFRSEPMGTFELNANGNLSYSEDLNLTDTVFFDIFNADNPTLSIQDISFFRYPTMMFCYLEKGMEPTLFTGSKKLKLPDYDIGSFAHEKSNAVELAYGKLETLPQIESLAPMSKPFYESKTFMWICLATGILVLGWFAIKMVPTKAD